MPNKTGDIFDLKLLQRLLKYAKPYRKVFYFVGLAAVLLSFFGVARPYLTKVTIDAGIIPQSHSTLVYYVMLMLLALVLEAVFQFLFIYFANWLGQMVIRDIRTQLFEHMLGFKKQYFDKSAVGRLVTRAVNDIETIASIFSEGLFMIFSDLLKMAVVLVVMFIQDWRLTLLVLIVLPFIIYATRVFQIKMKAAFEEVRNQVANLNTFVQERLTGMKIVQIFGREKEEYEKFKKINAKHRNAWIKTVWYNSFYFPIADISSSFAFGLVVWYGGISIMGDSGVSLGVIVMFLQLIQILFTPLRQIANKFNTMQMGMVAANRVFKILDTSSNISDEGRITAEKLTGNIRLEDVHFSYIKGEEVVKGISLQVNAGETVAIVGATGAGKSTIINLLSRFYEIDSGKILIDGQDIRNFTVKSLRKQVAVVLQDVFLFADTIMNNITLGNPEVSREEVVEAAKQIGVHEFISALPGGYDYNVKERGAMLSSGQRQLISFLRAYVTKPSILVLDEATSSVDTESEQLIQQATHKITQGRTSIVIAHRLATIKKADKIIVMDHGKIVEEGTHDQLLTIENGYYRNLYEVQFMQEGVEL